MNPSSYSNSNGQDIERHLARSDKGMVASASPLATLAGLRILRNGGNAVAAAVVIATTLNVVEPYMSGVGGVGVALLYIAK